MKKKENQKPEETETLTTSIYEVRAEKVLFCHPPAQWHVEAKVAVYGKQKTEETVYISICGWEPDMAQVTRNSIFSPEAGTNPKYKIDVIESYDSMKEARTSCYWNAIQKVRKLLNHVDSI